MAVRNSVDPITVQVVWNGLLAAANEMKSVLRRSSYNPIINEMNDFSVGLFNEDAETIAQAPGIPAFLCDIPSAIKSIAEDIGGFDRFREGDVYLTNDPYANTFHVHDVNLITPVFYSGALVGFAGARAHWHDIGGASGAGGTNSTEVFQEGMILRSIKMHDAGVLDENVLRFVRENTRLPETVLGDIRAQMGACTIGALRLQEVIAKYGLEEFRKSVNAILDSGEQLARERLAGVPEGEYEAETCLDDDGVEIGRRIPVRVKVVVRDGSMVIDVGGSSGPARGPFNCNVNTTTSFCRLIFKILTTPTEPANEGHFRPLEVRIPDRSLFNAKKPSATLLGFFALEAMLDAIKTALAPAMGDRVNAHDYGKCTPAHFKGYDKNGRYFIFPDTEGGGMGGNPFTDGESGIKGHDTVVVPIEVLEAKFPIRAMQYRLRQDSGGPGRRRGGLGVVKDYLCLVDIHLNAGFDRQACPPAGILGGLPAQHNRIVVKKGNEEVVLPSKVTDYLVRAGEVVSLQTGGGGGYGDPREREAELVRYDLEEGFISLAQTTQVYGLKLDADGVVDSSHTLRGKSSQDG